MFYIGVVNIIKDIIELAKKSKKKYKIIIFPESWNIENFIDENILFYPNYDIFPFESIKVSNKIKALRIKTLYNLLTTENTVIFTTFHSLSRYTIPKHILIKEIFNFKINQDFKLNPFLSGYNKTWNVYEYCEFSQKGFVKDIFIPIYNYPIRIELFDDEITRINFFDIQSQKSIENLNSFTFTPGSEFLFKYENNYHKNLEKFFSKHQYNSISLDFESFETLPAITFLEKNTILDYIDLNKTDIFVINENENIKSYYERERENLEFIFSDVKKELYKEYSGKNIEKILKLDYKPIEIDKQNFLIKKIGYKKKSKEIPVLEWDDLNINDLIVHEDYGVGIYKGLKKIKTHFGEKELIKIEYENKAKVFLPIERIDKITKYVGDKDLVKIDKIGSNSWQKRKKKVEENIRNKVKELIKLYALREYTTGISLNGDEEIEEKFKKTFEYIETIDQEKAIEETLNDLSSTKPMDRLIAGDAGFGKTEVSLRAVVRTVSSGYQAAILVPTTILAQQYFDNTKERFEKIGIIVELIDRFKTPKEKNIIINKINSGKIDVIIGTHALLNKNIKFKKLGLLIIDEEQRFGVFQKEKLKEISHGINVLTMSATPIPRTLYFSLTGLRDLSIISTPPFGRIPVETFVFPYSEKVIRTAILREKSRGGQTLYIHNRINDIVEIEEKLRHIIPEVKIVAAHGRMQKKYLSKIIKLFYNGEIDVLIATTIIENGVDIPNANTLIVDDAERYGISQLYQLRGRVGRSNKRAFAYFLYKSKLKTETMKRLEAIKSISGPGSGMKLALQDLEIRGFGDLLGVDQKGHINSVGLHMYKEILNRTIAEYYSSEMPTKEIKEKIDLDIKGIKSYLIIPEKYIENPIERMRIYRLIANETDINNIDNIRKDIEDRFGKIPKEVINLLEYAKLRIIAYKKGAKNIEIYDNTLIIEYNKQLDIDIKLLKKHSRRFNHFPEDKKIIVYSHNPEKTLFEIFGTE
ncbi:transcription-repair coupling factor (superfamily II helicase) [Marinitoga hydrogenitolerans DSM 16785]|uniref:Transcription-repair-coupling factor n=1 Tax=Marinitoga hydrogenitolerans (strain DSM 16785 / JCM 12826 / AT1271) TaxID=1122195 RepID=A0A1M4X4G2_MARH1|nr:DEAD/DEAH box helicase [Marinitoga hydrogenitolerans]SHE88327.1 transcription-repair coupling factor (superfamily II helicase) [Marinitoga hydrogenitolerans DSM 16785]